MAKATLSKSIACRTVPRDCRGRPTRHAPGGASLQGANIFKRQGLHRGCDVESSLDLNTNRLQRERVFAAAEQCIRTDTATKRYLAADTGVVTSQRTSLIVLSGDFDRAKNQPGQSGVAGLADIDAVLLDGAFVLSFNPALRCSEGAVKGLLGRNYCTPTAFAFTYKRSGLQALLRLRNTGCKADRKHRERSTGCGALRPDRN